MTKPNEPGIGQHVTINGTHRDMGRSLDSRVILVQTLSETAGRPKLDAWYPGAGLPNVTDRREWTIEYSIVSSTTDDNAEWIEFLRTLGGVHTLADWKAHSAHYTAAEGQQVFYLARPDAFSQGYSGYTADEYKAEVYINGTAIGTVTYKTSVADDDGVPADTVWISNASMSHPGTGWTVAKFKIGTAISVGDVVRVVYYPLYRVALIDAPTRTFEQANKEDKSVLLTEVA